MEQTVTKKPDTATLAGGCFWCTEAVFKRVNGVLEVVPGYSGGTRENPTSEQIYTGVTGHAEVVQLTFDPSIISYLKLLDIFFAIHDPTSVNKQGWDVGNQYRSAIFFHSDKQKREAEDKIHYLEKHKMYSRPIVTEIIPFTNFYNAEKYHLNYYDANPSKPYCKIIIDPKIRKLLENYSSEVKKEYK